MFRRLRNLAAFVITFPVFVAFELWERAHDGWKGY